MSEDALTRYRAQRLIAEVRAAQEPPTVEPEPCDDCEDDAPVTAASPNDQLIHGVTVPFDLPTGDGRKVRAGVLTWDLEGSGVPIIWDREDGDHSGMILGRVDRFVDDGGAILSEARLFATEDPEAAAAVARVIELIGEGAIGWSVMIDDEEVVATFREPEVVDVDGVTQVRFRADDQMFETVSGRIRHLALVDTAAWPTARPALGPLPVNASVAALATYQARHFDKWESDDLVPLQVTADGRVFGHAAGAGCGRDGRKGTCDTYKADPDPAMRNFHTGTATLDNGAVIRVGALTCAGLHADIRMSHQEQRQHHENSTTVWAKVVAWNDAKGRLCVSGAVVPGLDSTLVAQVAGLPISPELWPVRGVKGLTMCGMHSVITPLWPVL